jgi:threonyl-tRNA synthetase
MADFSDERLSKRIRDAQVKKIPYQLIIGDNEIEKDNVSYREYGQQETHTLKLDEFLKLLQTRIQERK